MNSHCCSVGVQFCSGVRFQLFSDVLHLFQTYFCSDLCCSWLLLDAFTASLFTGLLKKIFKDAISSDFLPITANNLSLHLCVQYITLHYACINSKHLLLIERHCLLYTHLGFELNYLYHHSFEPNFRNDCLMHELIYVENRHTSSGNHKNFI